MVHSKADMNSCLDFTLVLCPFQINFTARVVDETSLWNSGCVGYE